MLFDVGDVEFSFAGGTGMVGLVGEGCRDFGVASSLVVLAFGVLPVVPSLGVLDRAIIAGLCGGNIAPPPLDLLRSRCMPLAAETLRGDCPTPMGWFSVAGDGTSIVAILGVLGWKAVPF